MTEKANPLTKKEKINRNIMLSCFAAGGLIGGTLATIGLPEITAKGEGGFAAGLAAPFSDAPLPASIAIGLVVFWLALMPIISVYWWRKAVDEQEAAAYREGAFYAANAYVFIAPSWWILWRGGILPEPSGTIIFLGFNLIWLSIWFWKKYR